ncbi:MULTISPECIES: TonB-dependent siderophore receptor [unclassified Sphingomonas]|uniref:TonB-dependent siderophore receptor n=1 Tax=unclassified Sphingomonas TaxID=196159 RepID=UPI000694FE54|nr:MULTISPECIES: TonB-dependent siderophore receptor [unclassified Sphingomonas]MDY1009138.1 TonB-dependent siderophore receptor [Sphingomonas sp. CFBP9019]
MSDRRFARLLLAGTILTAALPATPAWAGFAPEDTTPNASVAAATRPDESDTSEPQDHGVIVVTGEKATTIASSGTKSATPIVETPQSISVINAADIAGLGLQNLNQALRFVAGVTPETRGASAEVYDQFKLRGFDAPVYLDGLRQFGSATGYAVPQVDVSRLDRVEIIKGPASVLYGQSSPGGLVAEVSKLPLDRATYGAVSGTYGTYDLYRVDADIGGRAGDGVLWRIYGSANGADDQQTQGQGKRERQTISAAVTAGAGSSTSFTLLGAYSHDPFNGNYGVFPTLGTLIDNPAGKISTKFYGGEPGDFFRREQAALTYIFNHDFGSGWALRSSGRYQYVKSRMGLVYTSGPAVDPLAVAPTLYARSSYSTREQLNNWTFDNQLTGKVVTGPVTHNLLFGVDRQVAHSAGLSAFGGGTPIDVFNPVYGTMPTPQTPADVQASFGIGSANVRQRQQGIYAQDQIAVGGLRVTLSGRQDWARQERNGKAQKDEKFTWRAGALYLLPFGLAPYASYSTSFQPENAELRDGSPPKPSLGKQIEAGAKFQPTGTAILVTAAWFRIEQTNVVVSYPDFTAEQIGKVRSQGVEVEASAPLPYGFNAKLAYSRQRVKKVEDVVAANIGLPLATVGRGGISANLEWAPTEGPASGFAIGGAVRHVDKTYADFYSDRVARYSPAYTVFDALLRYDLGKLSPRLANVDLGVNATNLFDKKYLTSCFANYAWCWYGNRRTVQATIGYRW